MDDRFDQEFFKSKWQRVLPLRPGGIQPYVHAARTLRLPGLPGDLGRLIAALGAVAQGVIALGRFAAIGMAERPILLANTPRAQWQRRSGRLADEPTCSAARRAAATRCVCEVA